MSNTFYHVTPQSNVSSILANGLMPAIGPRSQKLGEEVPASYHFSNPQDLMTGLENWLLDAFDDEEAIALLCITEDPKENEFIQVHFEHQCHSLISPKNIEVISLDLDNESALGLIEKVEARLATQKRIGTPSP